MYKLLFRIFSLFMVCFSVSISSFAQNYPSTEDFMNALQGCAIGAEIKLSADLKGSIKSFYDQELTRGRAELISKSAYLEAMPPEDRLEAARIYQSCLLKLLKRDESRGDISNLPKFEAEVVSRQGSFFLVIKNEAGEAFNTSAEREFHMMAEMLKEECNKKSVARRRYVTFLGPEEKPVENFNYIKYDVTKEVGFLSAVGGVHVPAGLNGCLNVVLIVSIKLKYDDVYGNVHRRAYYGELVNKTDGLKSVSVAPEPPPQVGKYLPLNERDLGESTHDCILGLKRFMKDEHRVEVNHDISKERFVNQFLSDSDFENGVGECVKCVSEESKLYTGPYTSIIAKHSCEKQGRRIMRGSG